jgi:hypothetical protein
MFWGLQVNARVELWQIFGPGGHVDHLTEYRAIGLGCVPHNMQVPHSAHLAFNAHEAYSVRLCHAGANRRPRTAGLGSRGARPKARCAPVHARARACSCIYPPALSRRTPLPSPPSLAQRPRPPRQRPRRQRPKLWRPRRPRPKLPRPRPRLPAVGSSEAPATSSVSTRVPECPLSEHQRDEHRAVATEEEAELRTAEVQDNQVSATTRRQTGGNRSRL